MKNQIHIMAKRVHTLGVILCLSSLTLTSGIVLAQPSETLQTFTHIASIPSNVDPATIRFESVKATKIATELKSTMEAASYCNWIDAKTSLYCPQEKLQSYVPAYEVTYSYAGLADEFGNSNETFQVYLRPEELPAALKNALASRKLKSDRSAEYFTAKTLNVPTRRTLIDESKSDFCAGNFVEGIWNHTDSNCQDKVSYKTELMPSDRFSVQVEAISLASVEASNRNGK